MTDTQPTFCTASRATWENCHRGTCFDGGCANYDRNAEKEKKDDHR